MAGLTLFYCFLEDLAEGKHNLGANTLKIALTNTAPALTNTKLADIVQITAANGYAAGGTAAAITSSAQTAGAYKLILGDVTFTATGGSIGPFRYLVLYNDTATDRPLIGFADYGVAYTVPAAQTFVADFSASDGVLQLSA